MGRGVLFLVLWDQCTKGHSGLGLVMDSKQNYHVAEGAARNKPRPKRVAALLDRGSLCREPGLGPRLRKATLRSGREGCWILQLDPWGSVLLWVTLTVPKGSVLSWRGRQGQPPAWHCNPSCLSGAHRALNKH